MSIKLEDIYGGGGGGGGKTPAIKTLAPLPASLQNVQQDGGYIGGEVQHASDTTVTVTPVACWSDDLAEPIILPTATTYTITNLTAPYVNIFVVKDSAGTVSIAEDTDDFGANLPATAVYKRWLGFVRLASSKLLKFQTTGREIIYDAFVSSSLVGAVANEYPGVKIDTDPILPASKIATLTFAAKASLSGSIGGGVCVGVLWPPAKPLGMLGMRFFMYHNGVHTVPGSTGSIEITVPYANDYHFGSTLPNAKIIISGVTIKR